jgi:hypothetical protein
MGTAPPPPDQTPTGERKRRWTAGRIVSAVFGGILTFLGIALVVGGGAALWVDQTQRDDAGFLTTGKHPFSTDTFAIGSKRIDLGKGPRWFYPADLLDDVRIRVTPSNPTTMTFVGIGREDDVNRYLERVRHVTVSDFGDDPTSFGVTPGGSPPTPPTDQTFWVAESAGSGTQVLTWSPESGSWEAVVMNQDGSAGIDVDADIGAKIPSLLWIAVGLLIGGAVFLTVGLPLLIVPIRRAARA